MTCTSPYITNPDAPRMLQVRVPCGRCRACRIARAREWSTRLLHELEYHEDATFTTLTYNDDNLPELGSLVPSDLQKFFKRLRKDVSGKIRYYACGEYGETTFRPHYHAIIFGVDPFDSVIQDNWPYGFVKNGTVTYDSCRYVADYIGKSVLGKEAQAAYYGQLVPPFARMSQGLGKQFIYDNADRIRDTQKITVRGVPVGLPRYYRKKLDLPIDVPDAIKRQKEVYDYFRLRGANDILDFIHCRDVAAQQYDKNLVARDKLRYDKSKKTF